MGQPKHGNGTSKVGRHQEFYSGSRNQTSGPLDRSAAWHIGRLNVQIADALSVSLDELTAGRDTGPHQHIEGAIRCCRVFNGDL